MTHWRPRQSIRVLAIGLATREGHLLAAEVRNDAGQLTGVRPLGGEIEFGETRDAALIREFREELTCTVAITGPWIAIENLFVHEGVQGHEIVFAAPVRILDRVLPLDAPVAFEDGVPAIARWFALDRLRRGEIALYPTGLAERIGL
ncbi:NUDIX hydrolase [Antarcticirhabdus aurantiaca]|uniref:NUDIX domain-containing protein n=1 Tax=Antarcticirhabdus aurantiaca TaxID=2606717 RepID=A0ACD4NPP5_9HYPH|nr:NUDIX domain-containing protein [Antarcticirhabdus aurantiaca]WAJ28815.1 NUDIX domain-containing protein [Jeongeuplla avenae]